MKCHQVNFVQIGPLYRQTFILVTTSVANKDIEPSSSQNVMRACSMTSSNTPLNELLLEWCPHGCHESIKCPAMYIQYQSICTTIDIVLYNNSIQLIMSTLWQ